MGFEVGTVPFEVFGPAVCLAKLRRRLRELEVPKAGLYKLHDFRRGHAQDLLESGAGLALILKAGEWKSAAFLAYVDWSRLEEKAVLEAQLADSDGE